MRVSYDEDVRGRTVVDATGRAIGEVLAVYFDTDALPGTLIVDGLRVRVRNEVAERLGVEHGTFRRGTIDVPAQAIQGIGDAVVLRVEISSLVTPAAEAPSPPHD